MAKVRQGTTNRDSRAKDSFRTRAVLICVLAILLLAALVTVIVLAVNHVSNAPEETDAPTEAQTEPMTDIPGFEPVSLGSGITITRFGPYAGLFVEDGSDRITGGTASVTVENNGTDAVQLMDFTLRTGHGNTYEFELTTLLPGQRVTVLDKHEQKYDPKDTRVTAAVDRYGVFSETPSLHEDVLGITPEGSGIRVTNLSDKTIAAGRVFYKNKSGDRFIGGITYMLSFTGLKPGESVSLQSVHYSPEKSEIVFTTFTE